MVRLGKITVQALIALGGPGVAMGQGPRATPCLHYTPAVVELRGRLVLELHYGPPNYGEDTAHDEKGLAPVLVLRTPIAVCGDTGSEEFNRDTFPSERRLQFVILQGGVHFRPFLHQDLQVAGRLYQGQTAHYFTNVAIEVCQVRLADGRVLAYPLPIPRARADSEAVHDSVGSTGRHGLTSACSGGLRR
jgi:hypothetical protein